MFGDCGEYCVGYCSVDYDDVSSGAEYCTADSAEVGAADDVVAGVEVGADCVAGAEVC